MLQTEVAISALSTSDESRDSVGDVEQGDVPSKTDEEDKDNYCFIISLHQINQLHDM